MKLFRTHFTIVPDPMLRHDRPILTLGSCFAEHVGQRLLDNKWSGLNAPFGTLFHPLALEKVMRLAVEDQRLASDLFVEHDGSYFHHDLHSCFYATSPEQLAELWQKTAASVRLMLGKKPIILLTLGTAFVYELKASSKIVANCHKQSAALFEKRLLSATEILASLQRFHNLLPEGSRVICSLSPVRHIRDTVVGNSISKSLLRVALHEWSQGSLDHIHYFPAYEILMDDLRDYRFYEADMIHPNDQAIEYIWQKFVECYCDSDAQEFLRRWQPILTVLQHRPQRLGAPSYQQFLRKILRDLEQWKSLDLDYEKSELASRLC